jgi:ATP-dependent protease Clp ATPase subunit
MDTLRCSFCRKQEKNAGKLIASPQSHPGTYICDECVYVCHSILEDERHEADSDKQSLSASVSFAHHPLAPELLSAVQEWAVRDLAGLSALDRYQNMREIAARMLGVE